MKVPVAVSLLVVCLRTSLAAPVIRPGAGNLLQELQQLSANKELGITVQDKIYQSQLPSWQCETHHSDGESLVICAGTWTTTNPPPNVTKVLQQLWKLGKQDKKTQNKIYQSQLPGWQCETHQSDGDTLVICAGTWTITNPPPNPVTTPPPNPVTTAPTNPVTTPPPTTLEIPTPREMPPSWQQYLQLRPFHRYNTDFITHYYPSV